MKIIASEGGVALRTFSLSSFVSSFYAFNAKHVKTLGENCVLVIHVAARTSKLRLNTKYGLRHKLTTKVSSSGDSRFQFLIVASSGVHASLIFFLASTNFSES